MLRPEPDSLDQELIRGTENWKRARWRGHTLWQNLLDLNAVSEFIFSWRPEVVVETGTFEGGSAIFLADVMRLAGVPPEVLTIDEDPRATPEHEGVTYLTGRSSTDPQLLAEVLSRVRGRRAFVVLDSDHSGEHVLAELRGYAGLVPVGGYVLVQDGNLYSSHGWEYAETPLPGIERFLDECAEFHIDDSRRLFATTAHPFGWLRRVR